MTGEKSRLLKVGQRVLWQCERLDQGTVASIDWAGVAINWDGQKRQRILHNDMKQIELTADVATNPV